MYFSLWLNPQTLEDISGFFLYRLNGNYASQQEIHFHIQGNLMRTLTL